MWLNLRKQTTDKDAKNLSSQKVECESLCSIISVATTTKNQVEENKNQDSCEIAENKYLNLRAIIVADGLGSYKYAEHASKFVTKSIRDQIESFRSKKDIDFIQMFKNTKSGLIRFVKDFEKKNSVTLDRKNSFGTTLIVTLEDDNKVSFAYVGNGAIWHIRGNFNHFHKTKYLPWNALNYLNPHSVQNDQGKEAIYRMISISDDAEEVVPTVLHIDKDNLSYGDIFMICTDGIYSYDQIPIGKYPEDDSIWISGERAMYLFYQYLNDYFLKNPNPNNESLQKSIQIYLDLLKKKNLLDDDATIGVIITSKAIEYQKKYPISKQA